MNTHIVVFVIRVLRLVTSFVPGMKCEWLVEEKCKIEQSGNKWFKQISEYENI